MEALTIKEIVYAVRGALVCGNKNLQVTSVCINSKEIKKGDLFVPIVGEKTNAHKFINDAFDKGAVATFISEDVEKRDDKIYIKVDDTIKALQALATYYRNKFDIKIIGITGSVGKTTTKEMIAAALSTKYNVLKTSGNMNSQIGVALMMLCIEKEHELAVIEMGISEFDEMDRLVSIVKPCAAVITNIGVSHIGNLLSQENIRAEKLKIINEFNEDKNSVLFLNCNDSLLNEIVNKKDIKCNHVTKEKLANTKIVTFGNLAQNVQMVDGKSSFDMKLGESLEHVVINVLGNHNVYNAEVAILVANMFGIKPSEAKKGLEKYKPISMRGCITKINEITIIDDTYNASPDSIKGAIEILTKLTDVKRKIVVLADILELGKMSYKCHYEVGEFVAKQDIYEVITIGKEAMAIAKAVCKNNSGILVNSFNNNTETIRYLKEHLKKDDAILIKGSRGMYTDEIVKAIMS